VRKVDLKIENRVIPRKGAFSKEFSNTQKTTKNMGELKNKNKIKKYDRDPGIKHEY
jgi:hypothetical protein